MGGMWILMGGLWDDKEEMGGDTKLEMGGHMAHELDE
jgi:hypothetical protein